MIERFFEENSIEFEKLPETLMLVPLRRIEFFNFNHLA